MREVRITTPATSAARIASVARSCGLDRVTEYAVYIHGPDEAQTVLSVETSTPNARRFIEALVAAPFFDPRLHVITSRDLRAVVSETPVSEVTMPIMASRPDIDQELWQASHVTPSYLGRT